MNKNLLSATLLMLFVLLVSKTGAAESETFKLKRRSTFKLQESARNPFWPIGWTKPTAVAPTVTGTPVVEVAELHPQDFQLTAILLGTPAMVVINGKEYVEGDFLKMPGGAKVQLARVLDGQVILRFGGKNYPIILQRKGDSIGAKKPLPSFKLDR